MIDHEVSSSHRLRAWTSLSAAYGVLAAVMGGLSAFLGVALDGWLPLVVGTLLSVLLWADAFSVVALMVRPGWVHIGADSLTIDSPVLLKHRVEVPWSIMSPVRETTKWRARGGQAQSRHPSLAFLGPRRVLVLEFSSPVEISGRRAVLPLWRNQYQMFVMSLPGRRGRERGVILSLGSDGSRAVRAVVETRPGLHEWHG